MLIRFVNPHTLIHDMDQAFQCENHGFCIFDVWFEKVVFRLVLFRPSKHYGGEFSKSEWAPQGLVLHWTCTNTLVEIFYVQSSLSKPLKSMKMIRQISDQCRAVQKVEILFLVLRVSFISKEQQFEIILYLSIYTLSCIKC